MNQTARHALVVGGAGFIGTNLTAQLLQSGAIVSVFDNFSRAGSTVNLKWLREQPGARRLQFICGDVRDRRALTAAVAGQDEIYHFAAQVAVTRSLEDPQLDFDVNLRGTVNLLEAARKSGRNPFLLFTSTNKVYGTIEAPSAHAESGEGGSLTSNGHGSAQALDTGERRAAGRLAKAAGNGHGVHFAGVSEDQRLDFHSPYGCSKGAADQYVRDYARVFALPTVVFRMSCIYGPHQFGNEDQGWVAHFAISALLGREISIYGDGRQVRDILFVEDLVAAIDAARLNVDRTAGQIYNIGGGPENAVSLLEVIAELEQLSGQRIRLNHGPWRVGDQRLYVSDTRRFHRATRWAPRVGVAAGLARLYHWLAEHRRDLESSGVPERDKAHRQGGTAAFIRSRSSRGAGLAAGHLLTATDAQSAQGVSRLRR